MTLAIEAAAGNRAQAQLPPRAQQALDTILRRPVAGIGSWLLNIMEHAHLERIAGVAPGAYRADPVAVYRAVQQTVGVGLIDQWIPFNPLTMDHAGFGADTAKTATTGATQVVLDGLPIETPEDVVRHLEQVVFPDLQRQIAKFDEPARVREILAHEARVQTEIGAEILKTPYGVVRFPTLAYGRYGYENYFMVYGLYPEVMERHFALQADLALLHNRAAARAFGEGALPPFSRLDHDMADSRGTLVSLRSLERLWFPHFARCLQPVLAAGVRLIWHCDGNLMAMLPRLLEVGLAGFQGFQYEDGMDYRKICGLRTKTGAEPLIIAGVSVTRTLPMGRPDDVKNELRFLVENGPRRGLMLGASSSIVPGVPWANLQVLLEGLAYYRTNGRTRD